MKAVGTALLLLLLFSLTHLFCPNEFIALVLGLLCRPFSLSLSFCILLI